jgi:hypothetical protein
MSDCHFAVQLNHYIPVFFIIFSSCFYKVTIGFIPIGVREGAGEAIRKPHARIRVSCRCAPPRATQILMFVEPAAAARPRQRTLRILAG